MPSFIPHIIFGRKLLCGFRDRNTILDQRMFLAGNLMPDLVQNHRLSHFHIRFSDVNKTRYDDQTDLANFFHIPDIETAAHEYSKIDDPSCRIGVNAHLFLDEYYIKNFLVKKFKIRDGIVTSPNGLNMPVDKFFSENGLYGAYDTINKGLLCYSSLSYHWLEETISCRIPLAPNMPLLNNDRDPKFKDWISFVQNQSSRSSNIELAKIITAREILKCIDDAVASYFKDGHAFNLNCLTNSELQQLLP